MSTRYEPGATPAETASRIDALVEELLGDLARSGRPIPGQKFTARLYETVSGFLTGKLKLADVFGARP